MQVVDFRLGTKDYYVVVTYKKHNANMSDQDTDTFRSNDTPKDELLHEAELVAALAAKAYELPDTMRVGLNKISFYNTDNEETAEAAAELSVKLGGTNKYGKFPLPRWKRKPHVAPGTNDAIDDDHNTLQEHVDKLEEYIEAYIGGDRLQREIQPAQEPAAAPQKNLFGFPKKK